MRGSAPPEKLAPAPDWRFVGEAIEVEAEERDGVHWPLAILWRGRRCLLAKVLSHWEEHSWRDLSPSQRRWYNQTHRAYFIVATDSGEVLEIYMQRNALRKPWAITRRLNQVGPGAAEPPPVDDGSR